MSPWPILRVQDRKSTRLNSSHTVIYTLSLHDALPISSPESPLTPLGTSMATIGKPLRSAAANVSLADPSSSRSEEHTSELQSHSDLHSFPTRRSSDLFTGVPFDAAGNIDGNDRQTFAFSGGQCLLGRSFEF